jgi:hypothetical protein
MGPTQDNSPTTFRQAGATLATGSRRGLHATGPRQPLPPQARTKRTGAPSPQGLAGTAELRLRSPQLTAARLVRNFPDREPRSSAGSAESRGADARDSKKGGPRSYRSHPRQADCLWTDPTIQPPGHAPASGWLSLTRRSAALAPGDWLRKSRHTNGQRRHRQRLAGPSPTVTSIGSCGRSARTVAR